LPSASAADTARFPRNGSLRALAADVLKRYAFAPGWDDLDGDAQRIAAEMETRLPERSVEAIELLTSVFFRGKGAYLVGKAVTDRGEVPWLLALVNPDGRVVVDALLMSEDEVSIVFSFARSYFLVEMDRPRETVAYL